MGILKTGLIAFGLLWSGGLFATPQVNLFESLRGLVPYGDDDFYSHELAKNCVRPTLTLDSPIRDFLSEKFFFDCFRLTWNPQSANRGFRLASALEKGLRAILAKYHLTLDMNEEEIQLAEQSPDNVLFKPLAEINFKAYGHGLTQRVQGLRQNGILLVRDFLRAFERELEMPQEFRWSEMSGATEKSAHKIKLGIDNELRAANQSDLDPPLDTKVWLRLSRNSSNPRIRDACVTLLKEFTGD